jgi:hypothetical protein
VAAISIIAGFRTVDLVGGRSGSILEVGERTVGQLKVAIPGRHAHSLISVPIMENHDFDQTGPPTLSFVKTWPGLFRAEDVIFVCGAA